MAQSRQLGPSEDNWTKCTAGGTGIAIFGIALKQQVGLHSVVLAAKSVCDRHAVLRSRIVFRKQQKPSLEVMEAAAPSVEAMSWPEVSSKPGPGLLVLADDDQEQSLSRALNHIVTSELNLGFTGDEAVDVFQVHVYSDPSKTSTVLVLRVHCGACDRHSTVVVARQFLLHLDAAVSGAADFDVAPAPDAAGLLPAMEDLAPKSSKGFFKKGLDAVGYARSSSKCSLLPFQPGFASTGKNSTPFRSEVLVYNLGKPGTENLVAACTRESTTLAAALSAAFLKAAANVNELKHKKQDTFAFTNVLNCRPYFDPPLDENVVGNYSAGLPQDVQVKDSVSFWDLARHVSATTDKNLAKSHQFSELSVLNMLLSQVLKHPSVTPQSSLRTALFTLFVDGPADCKWTGLSNNLRLAGTIGPIASMHLVGPCFSLAEALLDGPELCLTFVYVTPLYTETQMDEFLSGALELLKNSTK